MKYAVALHRAHLMLSTLVQPAADSTRRGALKGQELMEAHRRCGGWDGEANEAGHKGER